MKKKELFEQNTVLYNRLQTVTAELKKYKQLYNQNIEEINALRSQLEELKEKQAEVLETIEQQRQVTYEVPPTVEAKPAVLEVELEKAPAYGAEIIGKIVLEGTKINNSFAEKQSDLSVDIINLILGKTEVCKAKIYDICHSDIKDAEKVSMLDELYNECMDYFASLNKQVE